MKIPVVVGRNKRSLRSVSGVPGHSGNGLCLSMSKMNELVCDICGKAGARIRHVSRSYDKGKDLLVIENVPVISCPYCGESYSLDN